MYACIHWSAFSSAACDELHLESAIAKRVALHFQVLAQFVLVATMVSQKCLATVSLGLGLPQRAQADVGVLVESLRVGWDALILLGCLLLAFFALFGSSNRRSGASQVSRGIQTSLPSQVSLGTKTCGTQTSPTSQVTRSISLPILHTSRMSQGTQTSLAAGDTSGEEPPLVWISKDGRCFHGLRTCKGLRGATTSVVSVPLPVALSRGKRPCTYCR